MLPGKLKSTPHRLFCKYCTFKGELHEFKLAHRAPPNLDWTLLTSFPRQWPRAWPIAAVSTLHWTLLAGHSTGHYSLRAIRLNNRQLCICASRLHLGSLVRVPLLLFLHAPPPLPKTPPICITSWASLCNRAARGVCRCQMSSSPLSLTCLLRVHRWNHPLASLAVRQTRNASGEQASERRMLQADPARSRVVRLHAQSRRS